MIYWCVFFLSTEAHARTNIMRRQKSVICCFCRRGRPHVTRQATNTLISSSLACLWSFGDMYDHQKLEKHSCHIMMMMMTMMMMMMCMKLDTWWYMYNSMSPGRDEKKNQHGIFLDTSFFKFRCGSKKSSKVSLKNSVINLGIVDVCWRTDHALSFIHLFAMVLVGHRANGICFCYLLHSEMSMG